MPPGKPAETVLNIPAIEIKSYVIRIVGDSPLITHAWSEKAKKQIADKQQGKAVARKEPKNPEQEYEGAFYRLPDGTPAMRAIAFKSAAVDAATQLSGLTKVFLRGAFHVVGDLVAVEGVPQMREDMVKISMDVADIRYRPEFLTWAVNLTVRVNARAITLEQLIHLFNQAGFSSGVGEWRPQKDGTNGMFHVEGVQEVKG
jgi:hypothetical protein